MASPAKSPTVNLSSGSGYIPETDNKNESDTQSVSAQALKQLQEMQLKEESDALASKSVSIGPVQSTSARLEENLALAKKLVEFVIENVPISPNYLERTPIDYEKEETTMEAFHALINMGYEAANQEHAYEVFTSQAIQAIAATAMKIQIGTCLEMAAVGYDCALETGHGNKVEIFFIDGPKGNHVFLVIGRDPSSKPEDYKNWGPAAVVCDPWRNIY